MAVNFFSLVAFILLLVLAAPLYRLMAGPTFFDRVLSANMMSTKVVILILLTGYIFERPQFADLALTYAILNFISTIAILKVKERWRSSKWK